MIAEKAMTTVNQRDTEAEFIAEALGAEADAIRQHVDQELNADNYCA